jgi:endonuclease G
MARKPSAAKKKSPAARLRPFRRTRAFLWLNFLAALVVGGWYLAQPPARQAEVRLLVGNSFAQNKNVSPVDVAWDLWQLYYSRDFVAAAPPSGDRLFAYAGLPRVVSPELPAKRILTNQAYVVGYADEWGLPLWAAYRVKDITPLPPAGDRPERFEPDFRTVARIPPEAYTNSGFDRGHLAPNYAIATRHGEAAQEETFLMSNIIPQRHGLNAGLWKQLEQRAATSYPARHGEIWILAGPVFDAAPPDHARRLGADGAASAVRVPTGCFMILTDESDGRVRTLAFLFPQEPGADARLEDFLTTVTDIELRTGLDFFFELDSATQLELEARRATRVW